MTNTRIDREGIGTFVDPESGLRLSIYAVREYEQFEFNWETEVSRHYETGDGRMAYLSEDGRSCTVWVNTWDVELFREESP